MSTLNIANAVQAAFFADDDWLRYLDNPELVREMRRSDARDAAIFVVEQRLSPHVRSFAEVDGWSVMFRPLTRFEDAARG